jgi:hypothetical protein
MAGKGGERGRWVGDHENRKKNGGAPAPSPQAPSSSCPPLPSTLSCPLVLTSSSSHPPVPTTSSSRPPVPRRCRLTCPHPIVGLPVRVRIVILPIRVRVVVSLPRCCRILVMCRCRIVVSLPRPRLVSLLRHRLMSLPRRRPRLVSCRCHVVVGASSQLFLMWSPRPRLIFIAMSFRGVIVWPRHLVGSL